MSYFSFRTEPREESSRLDIERYIAESPKFGGAFCRVGSFQLFSISIIKSFWFFETGEEDLHFFPKAGRADGAKLITLRDAFDFDDGFGHLTDRFKFNHG